MTYLNWTLLLILFKIVTTRRIGFIADRILTYDSSIASTVTTFNDALSCDACLCAAFKSSLHYVALNCYRNNQTCSLVTASAHLNGTVASPNDSSYVLSDINLTFASAQTSNTELSTASMLSTSGAFTTRVASTSQTTRNRCVLNILLQQVVCID